MQITRAADYAVRVMIHLASQPTSMPVRRPEIAKATDVPGSFLSKVLQHLVQGGLISSQRGSGGGYRLAVNPENISLLDVVEAVEGPTQLNVCLQPGPSCARKSWCEAHVIWSDAQRALVKVLRATSIARLAKKSAEARACHGRDRTHDELKTVDLYGSSGTA